MLVPAIEGAAIGNYSVWIVLTFEEFSGTVERKQRVCSVHLNGFGLAKRMDRAPKVGIVQKPNIYGPLPQLRLLTVEGQKLLLALAQRETGREASKTSDQQLLGSMKQYKSSRVCTQ